MRIINFLCLILVVTPSFSYALDDGTYTAIVKTNSGTYSVPVEVDSGEVTHVEWPNGGNMSVRGAELQDGEASGYNSRGESISIEIEE